jgi:hypothetical protein
MVTTYVCGKNHTFIHPAKQTEYTYKDGAVDCHIEYQVCPICKSALLREVEEPQPTEVYIYDLTSGPQTELNGLLAQGYVVKSVYAKQYHLWKPKAAEKDYVAEAIAKKALAETMEAEA